MSGWTDIESDPAVFASLLDAFGAPDLTIRELYSLEDTLPFPCHGLLLLFKYDKALLRKLSAQPRPAAPAGLPPPWFATQTISNACGTLALLHVLLNSPGTAARLGPTLGPFRDFTLGLPPDERGASLADCAPIREAHNSFARPEPFLRDERAPRPGERAKDAFHFVAYAPCVSGGVFELDGLARAGPVYLGEGGGAGGGGANGWLPAALGPLRERLALAAGGDIRFTLLAVAEDGRVALRRAAAAAFAALQEAHALALSVGEEAGLEEPEAALARLPRGLVPAEAVEGGGAAEEGGGGGGGGGGPAAAYSRALAELEGLAVAFGDEEAQREAWARDNALRRHNFVPLILNLLGGLADSGALPRALEGARARAAALRAARAKEGAGSGDEE
jgi:ubiquitin carboxyl-terminal hydrolase L5